MRHFSEISGPERCTKAEDFSEISAISAAKWVKDLEEAVEAIRLDEEHSRGENGRPCSRAPRRISGWIGGRFDGNLAQ